jgi:hypothetical protein
MSRLSARDKQRIYEAVTARDRLFCFIGYEDGNEHPLFLHQWDCNPDDHRPENYRLLCFPMIRVVCPWMQKPSRSSIYSVSAKESILMNETPPATSLELLKSQLAVPLFCHWIFSEVVRRGQVPFEEALNSGSAIARISQATARRYLARDTSLVRIYHVVKLGDEKVICLRPEFERFRKVIADRRLLDQQAKNWRKDLLDGLPVTMGKRGSKDKRSGEKNAEERPQNQ